MLQVIKEWSLWHRIFLHSEMKNVMWSHFKDRNSVIPESHLFQIFLFMAAFKQLMSL